MDLKKYEEILTAFVKADVPLHVWGPGGVGKSQVTEAVAGKLGFHCVDLRLATQEVGDLIGIPYKCVESVPFTVGEDEEGNPITEQKEVTITRWAQPSWMLEIMQQAAAGRKTVLFLDEMDRAPKEVVQAVYQLVTKRRLHEHQLPEGTRVLAAGNPPTDEYMVESFDDAMVTRWGHIYVDASATAWLDGFGPMVDKDITGFIATEKDSLMHKATPWDVSSVCKPTPRGWEFVDRIYQAIGASDRTLLQLCISSIVGPGPANQFVSSLQRNWVTFEDIVSGKKTYGKHIHGKADEAVLTLRLANEMQRHITRASLVPDGITAKVKKERTERFGQLIESMLDGRRELVIAIVTSLVDRDRRLVHLLLKQAPDIHDAIYEVSSLAQKLQGSSY